MLSVLYNAARTLSVYLPERPGSDPSVTLYNPSGGSIATGTATRGVVETSLAAGAVVGAQSVTLTSATGVAVGQRYQLGGAEADGGETVTVKAIAGAVVSLVRPMILARSTGDAFVSTRVTFTVPAQTVIARGYRAEIGSPPVTIPFDVTRYALTTHLTIESLRALDPQFVKRIGGGAWWPDLLSESWNMLLRRVAVTQDPGGLQGTIDLTTAHGYGLRALVAETAGPDFEPYRASMAARCEQEYTSALAAAKWDANGDGIADKYASKYRTIPMVRA